VKRLLVIAVLAIVFGGPARADFQMGFDAYKDGDYTVAFREWKKLADEGDPRAQYNFGVLYAKGHGVNQDYAEAVKWYRRAAYQGYVRAQAVLATYYERGRGVTKNLGEAFRWYSKAAANGIAQAKDAVARIEKEHPEVAQKYQAANAAKPVAPAAGQKAAEKAPAPPAAKPAAARTTPASAADRRSTAPAAPAAPAAGPGEETLIYTVPPGWKLDTTRKLSGAETGDPEGLLQLASAVKVFTPGDQDLDNWSELFGIEEFRKVGLIAPYYLDQGMVQKFGEACDGGRGPEPSTQRIRGSLTIYGVFACPNNREMKRGMFLMLKVIEGRKNFYSIRRVWRGDPYAVDKIPAVAERFQAWNTWFNDVRAGTTAEVSRMERFSTGSGFVVNADGYVVTNNHVIDGCREVRIGAKTVTPVATAPETDLALLKTEGAFKSVVTFGKEGGLRVGESVVVAGYPLPGLLSSDLSITSGGVSALTGPGNDSRYLVITAPVQPGNSGGPLLDMQGEVVGVVVAKLNALKVAQITGDIPQNVNFAINAEVVKGFLGRNKVAFRTAAAEKKPISAADIGDRAKTYTVSVECWR
jgi:hypothetical protein